MAGRIPPGIIILIWLGIVVVAFFVGLAMGATMRANRGRSDAEDVADILRPIADGETIIELKYGNGKTYRMIEPGIWVEIDEHGRKVVRP